MINEKIGVVGMGLLGRGIAACFLGRGFEVAAVGRDKGRLEEAGLHIGKMIFELVDLAGFDTAIRTDWRRRFSWSTDFGSLRDCSFVVESVLEDAAIKHKTLANIESATTPEAIIASNSSALPITLLQQRCRHPDRVIGMHWAEPAHITRFLEIIRGDQTSDLVANRTEELGRKLGKDPSVCNKEIPGFIVNRIGYAMYREALNLLESGIADAETIDRSMRNALGMWATLCGPFRWIDLTGGPELYLKAMEPVLPTLSKAGEPSMILKDLAARGARGIVNGRGFFNYTPEEAKHWEELYRQHAWKVTRMQNEYFPVQKGTECETAE